MIDCDLQLERAARVDLQAAVGDCERLGDYVSRELLTQILQSEEEHIDWLETQQDLIARIGAERYTQSQMHD
jgi:bacterioferritin